MSNKLVSNFLDTWYKTVTVICTKTVTTNVGALHSAQLWKETDSCLANVDQKITDHKVFSSIYNIDTGG